MEELDPREEQIDPLAEIRRKLDFRALEPVGGADLDEGSVEKSCTRTIQKNETEVLLVPSPAVGFEERKAQARKPHMGQHGKIRALDLWLAQEVEARILGLIGENTGIGADGIGDQNFAGPSCDRSSRWTNSPPPASK